MTFRPHALHLKAELFVKSSRVHVRDDGFTRCKFHLKSFYHSLQWYLYQQEQFRSDLSINER